MAGFILFESGLEKNFMKYEKFLPENICLTMFGTYLLSYTFVVLTQIIFVDPLKSKASTCYLIKLQAFSFCDLFNQ